MIKKYQWLELQVSLHFEMIVPNVSHKSKFIKWLDKILSKVYPKRLKQKLS